MKQKLSPKPARGICAPGKLWRGLTAAALTITLAICPVGAAPELSARSAILVDAASGRVLCEKNAGRKSLIASTTKIMTGLLVAEAGKLDEEYTIPPEAVGIEGSSLYLREGETLTREQLLYGLMLRSGNDAAVALALAVAGDVESFVARMNGRAAELGLTDTHFANPNGLDDDGNYSTARDLAALTRTAMENETFAKVVGTKEYRFGNRVLINHNKLLWRCEGAVGVKTGYTKKAGRLLVSAAERDGQRLIAVTIDAPSDWADHAALLDYGYSEYTRTVLLPAGARIGAARVVGGESVLVQAVLTRELSYPLLPGEEPELRLNLPEFVYAPVETAELAGSVQAVLDGEVVAEVPLRWRNGVRAQERRKNWLERLFGK